MSVLNGRNPVLARLSLLLLVGVAGCTSSAGESPLLAGSGSNRSLAGAVQGQGVEQLVRMGQRSLAGGDTTTAIGLAQEALSRDGGSVEAALVLGYAQLAAGAPQEAGFAFGRILRHDPEHREAGIGYAKAMIAIGRTDAALDHLEPLAQRAPNDVEVLNLLGVAHDLEGAHAQAIATYRRALVVTPDAPDVSNNLGLSLALAGRHEEAIGVLRPLAEGYVSTARARQNLALAYGLAGSFDAAERWSQMDLSGAEVENNLRYFRLIGGLAPGAARSSALQPEFAKPVVEVAPMHRLGEPPADAAPAPTSVERLPAAVRPKAGFAADGAAVADVGVDVASVGSWFVNLAPLTEADWRRLRDQHREATTALYRLASGDEPDGPFIVGPFETADEANSLCRSLGDDVAGCKPVLL